MKTFSHLNLSDLEQLYNYRSGLLSKIESNQVLRLIMNIEKRHRKQVLHRDILIKPCKV